MTSLVLQFKSDGNPVVSEVVSARENFQIFSVGDKRFNEFVNLLRLLTLSTTL